MLWFVFAVLTLAVIAVLLMPILKGVSNKAPARVDYDIVVYRDQLAEIEKEIESGLLSEAQADAARAEVQRRMLAAEDAELKISGKPEQTSNHFARLLAIAMIAVVLPLGAITIYGILGSPQLPGEPYAWRLKNDPEFVDAATADKLAAFLQKNPSASGYARLADLYFSARKYEQAAAADRRAIGLGATDAATWSSLGEAITMMNGGAVVPEALQAFTNALGIDSRSERSRFFIGLAESQIGNLMQAVAIWRDLEKDSDPHAAWLPMLREHIAAFAKAGHFDPTSVPPAPPSASNLKQAIVAMTNAMQTQGGTNTPGTQSSNGDDQDSMIRSMVARLAARLEKSPDDAAGWQRLAHAYDVLGEREKAREAIDNAVRLKPADVGVLMTLAEIEKDAAPPGDDVQEDFVATMHKILILDPANVPALYYVGLAEQMAGHAAAARDMWNKALAGAAADDPLAINIHKRLDAMAGKTKAD